MTAGQIGWRQWVGNPANTAPANDNPQTGSGGSGSGGLIKLITVGGKPGEMNVSGAQQPLPQGWLKVTCRAGAASGVPWPLSY